MIENCSISLIVTGIFNIPTWLALMADKTMILLSSDGVVVSSGVLTDVESGAWVVPAVSPSSGVVVSVGTSVVASALEVGVVESTDSGPDAVVAVVAAVSSGDDPAATVVVLPSSPPDGVVVVASSPVAGELGLVSVACVVVVVVVVVVTSTLSTRTKPNCSNSNSTGIWSLLKSTLKTCWIW